jgi:hypothetical protein
MEVHIEVHAQGAGERSLAPLVDDEIPRDVDDLMKMQDQGLMRPGFCYGPFFAADYADFRISLKMSEQFGQSEPYCATDFTELHGLTQPTSPVTRRCCGKHVTGSV